MLVYYLSAAFLLIHIMLISILMSALSYNKIRKFIIITSVRWRSFYYILYQEKNNEY
jgi:hypothetical protein